MKLFKSLPKMALIWLLLVLSSHILYAFDNVKIYGTLVDEPCVILPEDQNITVDFATIKDRTLYQGNRIDIPFTIKLSECRSEILSTISITFNGDANKNGRLISYDAYHKKSGIEIGIESEFSQIVINKPIGLNPSIQSDNAFLNFNAYVQAESDAITNKSLSLGDFSAIASFVIDYQ